MDSLGATPLHVCAEKNLARPVRMLVDAGANVNVKHQKTGLTPLQMACCHDFPDVETIRSFLDKVCHEERETKIHLMCGRGPIPIGEISKDAQHSKW